VIHIRQKSNLKLEGVQAELMWLLGVLLEDDHRLFLITLPTTVDELNRLMQSEPAAKEMMYNLIARLSGDLAAFTEGLRQVDLYQTWAQTFEDLMVDKKYGIQEVIAEHTSTWSGLLKAIDGPDQAKITALGTPDDGRFYWPVDKRRSKENVAAM
jgi:hypothetical protein